MRTTTKRLGLAVCSLALILVPAGPASAARLTPFHARPGPGPAVTTAHIKLSPQSGPPSSQMTVSGSGFGHREVVDISFDATGEAHVTTGASGSFHGVRVGVPASALPGAHQVTAAGQRTGRKAHATFTVSTNWPEFRYSLPHTGLNPDENVLSPGDVAGLGKAWSFKTGFAVDSSPAVVNGTVYIGSDDNSVYAFGLPGGRAAPVR